MCFKKSIFRLILLISCVHALPCYCQAVTKQFVRSQLETIPEKERETLALFFEALIRLDTFGYALFGDKPISCEGLWKNYKPCPFSFNKAVAYRKGEEVLEKYSTRFNIKNFVVKFEHSKDWDGIYLVNKKCFINIVELHIDEFRRILGQHVTAEGLFLQIIDNRNTVGQVLKEDQCLIGILFGFGYKNAQMFKRRQEVLRDLHSYFKPPLALPEQKDFLFDFYIKENGDKQVTADDAQELLSEYGNLKKILKSASNDAGILNLFSEVGFWADLDDPETKRLLDDYGKTKIEIMNAFMSDNFLEVVLCKMAED